MRSFFALLLASSPALADVSSGGRTVECYCTDTGGSRIELGEMICLQVDGRMFTAQCQMSLNTPMWREVQLGCLTGAVDTPDLGPETGPLAALKTLGQG